MLNELNKKFGSDKGKHIVHSLSYLDIYETYFSSFKEDPIKLLELGVKKGKSLQLWKTYFINGKVYGVDLDKNCKKYEEDRIQVLIASQDDESKLKKLCNDAGGFDIIIDDASHINSLTLKSFSILFPYLRDGGVYIIEDLANSYDDLNAHIGKWDGELRRNKNDLNVSLKNERKDIDKFLLKNIKDMDMRQSTILSIQMWSMLCVIIKG